MPRQPRVFISRTTAGLADLAGEIAAILRERGAEVVLQNGFLPDWRSVPQMLQDKLHGCDSVIALLGPAHGGEPDRDPARLRDERTHGRAFSFTQWEYLVARDLRRPVFTFLVSGPGLVADFEKEDATLEQRQQQFIADFAKDRTSLYYEYTDRGKLLDHIRRMELPVNVSAGIPENLPYPSLGTLFKGRDEFLAQLRTQLAREKAAVIKGRQAIHGMGGVGKTRAAVEYAWAHAVDYRALLFVTADSPDALERNLAALCGPLVLNLPEQDARETAVQAAGVLRWLNQTPGWFLIIDNADTPEAQRAVAKLLGSIPEGHVVITSRLADWPAGVTALDLDVLSEESSIAFLLERTGDYRARLNGDRETAAQIARLLGFLPFALEQCAAYISHHHSFLTEVLGQLQSRPSGNDRLEFLLGEVVARFTDEELSIIATLRSTAEPISISAIAEMSAMPETTTRHALKLLTDRSVVIFQESTQRYVLEPTFGDFFREKRLDRLLLLDAELKKLAGPLSLYFDSKLYTAKEVAELIGYLSDYYCALTGDRLVIESLAAC